MVIATTCAGHTMSLKECVALGIANNLTLDNARIGMQKGRTTLSQSRSRLLPTVIGTFQLTDYLKSPVNVTTGTVLGNDFPDDLHGRLSKARNTTPTQVSSSRCRSSTRPSMPR